MASDTNLIFQRTLEPGGTDSQDTFMEHRFKLVPVSASEPAGCHESYCNGVIYKVEGQGKIEIELKGDVLQATWIGLERERPLLLYASEADRKLGQEKAKECLENLKIVAASGQDPHAAEEDAETFCNKYPTREFIASKLSLPYDEWQQLVSEKKKQLKRANAEQPPALKNFTHAGFTLLQRHGKSGQALRHTPFRDFFKASFTSDMDSLVKWYEENRKKARPEDHGLFDPSVSSYESDTWITPQPPDELRRPIFQEIRQGLERWADLPENSLEFIAFYGVRLYRNTSVLRRHVDFWKTHVLSAIVNVGKRGLTSPWPLRINHHDGSLHEVDDSPGDVIFYESAKCPHGRDLGRLKGREVANMFVHFKPRDWKPLDGSHLASNGPKVVADPVEL